MVEELIQIDNRNATSSWSGYSHQGKIGLVLILREIDKKLLVNEEDLIDWYAEFESAEDIDIKCSNNVITRHQVKAYKNGNTLKSYEDVLNIQEYNFKDGKKKLVTKGFRIRAFDELAKPLSIEVEEESRYLHTICEVTGFGYSKENYEAMKGKPIFVENPNNVKLYQYPNGNFFCNISENDKCKEFCMDLIKIILVKRNHLFKDNNLQHEFIFYELLNALDQEIHKKHLNGGYPTLGFLQVLEIITSVEKHEKENLIAVRYLFAKTWEEFLLHIDESELDYEDEHLKQVEIIMQELFRLSDQEFVQFIFDINPDKNIPWDATLECVTSFLKVDDLKYMFFECLMKVRSLEFNISQRSYMKDGGYCLTLISGSRSAVNTIMNKIITNRNITKVIFEKKYLVNRELDDIEFGSYINDLSGEKKIYQELKNNWCNMCLDLDEERKFYSPEISFTTYLKAIEKLEGDK